MCVCVYAHVCVCVFVSGLLSGPGLFRGAEQSRRKESFLDLKHLQACTFDFFFGAFSLLTAVSSHLDGSLSKGCSGGGGKLPRR